MTYDNSWHALMHPGAARDYFTWSNRPAFDPERADYTPGNAWWLAELSRMAYCDRPGDRKKALARAGLRKGKFFDIGGTECLVTGALDGSFAVVAFRGTTDLKDWLINIKASPKEWKQGGHVHEGFKEALRYVWKKVKGELDKTVPVFYTGHSLGAALATLAASRRPPRAVYTFGSPRVGDSDFAATLKDVPVFRVVNNRDVVTTLPPPSPVFELVHVGELHYIAHDDKMLVNPSDEVVEKDRGEVDEALADTVDEWIPLLYPPLYASDHSPINYVTHLEDYLPS